MRFPLCGYQTKLFKNSNISQENAWRPFTCIPHFNNNMLLGFGAVLMSAFEEFAQACPVASVSNEPMTFDVLVPRASCPS